MDNNVTHALHLEGISDDLEKVIRDGISISEKNHDLKYAEDGSFIFVTYGRPKELDEPHRNQV